MRAIEGHTYAQVINGRCHWLFDATMLLEWRDDAFVVVDVTGLSPQPVVGDVHLGGASFEPPPGPSAEQIRLEELNAAIAGDTTLNELKAMTNAEYNTWWDQNITTAGAAIAVLKRLARVIIRRVL